MAPVDGDARAHPQPLKETTVPAVTLPATTYTVTIYGRDAHDYPIVGTDTVTATTPAHALTEHGWDVTSVRHGHDGAVVAYRIHRHDDELGDVLVERTASDTHLWLVSIPGRGWIGHVHAAVT